MLEEAMILDGDERKLKMLRDIRERDIEMVLIHPEPAPAVRRQEPRVAHAAGQPVNGIALPEQPGQANRREDDQADEDRTEDAIPEPSRPQRHAHVCQARRRRLWSTSESTV